MHENDNINLLCQFDHSLLVIIKAATLNFKGKWTDLSNTKIIAISKASLAFFEGCHEDATWPLPFRKEKLSRNALGGVRGSFDR